MQEKIGPCGPELIWYLAITCKNNIWATYKINVTQIQVTRGLNLEIPHVNLRNVQKFENLGDLVISVCHQCTSV